MEDILKRLMNGETADDLAKEFTDALNAAVQEIEAKKEAEFQKAQKLMDAQMVIDAVADFVAKYYPEAAAEEELAFDAEELIEVLDKTIPRVVELNQAVVSLDKVLKRAAPAKEIAEPEDSILAFLQKNGLI